MRRRAWAATAKQLGDFERGAAERVVEATMRWFSLALVCAAPVAAFAQEDFVGQATSGERADQVDETLLKMRVDVTGGAFVESQYGEAPIDNTSITTPNSIFWMDVRGKLDARHISGSKFDVLGDLRVRLNPDPTAPSRGYQGGEEYDLKELHATYRGGTTEWGFGRQILRDVDAQTIDGITMLYKMSPKFELGLFGGLYPDPFARSLGEDYKVTTYEVMDDMDPTTPDPVLPVGSEFVSPIPLAAGGWTGYRYTRTYGALGLAAILPRNDDPPALNEPATSENRVLLTSSGYWRTVQAVDVIHYLVVEARNGELSPIKDRFLNAQLAVHYKPTTQLLIEGGASRMTSYTVEVYLRDLLERNHAFGDMCPDSTTLCIQNNLDVLRVASSEFRGGFNYFYPNYRLDLNMQLRLREREGLVLPEGLPIINADRAIDVQLGARRKQALYGFDVGVALIGIRGRRTAANIVNLRASKELAGGNKFLDIDAGYSQYQDMCYNDALEPTLDPRTCDGTARGFTYRIGALLTWQRDLHWLFIGDYHLNVNKAQARRLEYLKDTDDDGVGDTIVCAGNICSYPYMAGHSFFLRAQYRY